MKTVAIVSPSGGAGRSTVVAHLATLLARRHRSVLAIESDPANVLGFYLGLDHSSDHGLLPAILAGQHWAGDAFKSAEGVMFVPFGRSEPRDLARFQQHLLQKPHWLAQGIDRLAFDEGVVLIDTPRYPSLFMEQACQAADIVLVLLTAEPLSLVALEQVERHLAEMGKQARYVATRISPVRVLHSDILALSMQRLGKRLIPYRIHEDVAVPEAFAKGVMVTDYAPHSQTSHDLHGLCAWLEAYLDGGAL